MALLEPSGETNTSFRFDASSSNDPEGGALAVRWDWEDDGTYDTSWSATLTDRHTFAAVGTYTVRLQVSDNWDQADTTTRQVPVGQPAVKHRQYLPIVPRKLP